MPTTLCDELLKEYEHSDDWQATEIDGHKLDTQIRYCSIIGMSYAGSIDKNKPVRQKLDNDVFGCATAALQKYRGTHNNCLTKQDTGYSLLRYTEGQFYTAHTDYLTGSPREVACSFALNDNYEGGEFAFFDRQLKYKIPKGAAIMFPSNFMYPHEIMKVTKGTRYSLITWFT